MHVCGCLASSKINCCKEPSAKLVICRFRAWLLAPTVCVATMTNGSTWLRCALFKDSNVLFSGVNALGVRTHARAHTAPPPLVPGPRLVISCYDRISGRREQSTVTPVSRVTPVPTTALWARWRWGRSAGRPATLATARCQFRKPLTSLRGLSNVSIVIWSMRISTSVHRRA